MEEIKFGKCSLCKYWRFSEVAGREVCRDTDGRYFDWMMGPDDHCPDFVDCEGRDINGNLVEL